MGHRENNPKREICSITGLSQKPRKSSNKQSNSTPKELEKEPQTKPNVSRRKEIIKIRAELSDVETKRTIERISKSRSRFFENIKKINKLSTRLIKKKKIITSEMKAEKLQLIPQKYKDLLKITMKLL